VAATALPLAYRCQKDKTWYWLKFKHLQKKSAQLSWRILVSRLKHQ